MAFGMVQDELVCSAGSRASSPVGHADVSTTMIYTHVLNRPGLAVRSPLDLVGA